MVVTWVTKLGNPSNGNTNVILDVYGCTKYGYTKTTSTDRSSCVKQDILVFELSFFFKQLAPKWSGKLPHPHY